MKKFAAKKFRKSHNLVTLVIDQHYQHQGSLLPDHGKVLEGRDLLRLINVAGVRPQLLADVLELGVGGDELVDRRLGATVDQKVELFHWKKRSG